jgi:ribosomal protein S18 acetylase RimI-like enzyme
VDLRELTESDLAALQSLLERCSDLFLLTEDRHPSATEARELWEGVPRGTLRADKLMLGVFMPDLVGVAEIVRGWPRAQTWNIGLLALDPAVRGQGTGTATIAAIDRQAQRSGADRLRITVMPVNVRALAFWRRLGFTEVPPISGFATRPEHAVAIALERPVAVIP